MWMQLLLLLLICFSGWLIYRTIKGNPTAFSKNNLSRSIYLLGWLALGLIALVFVLVMILKHI
jgi:hypothetical protein